MCLIVLNGILLGVEIDVAAQLPLTEIPQWFGIVNALIVFAFLGETTLKLLALGCRKFWRGGHRRHGMARSHKGHRFYQIPAMSTHVAGIHAPREAHEHPCRLTDV